MFARLTATLLISLALIVPTSLHAAPDPAVSACMVELLHSIDANCVARVAAESAYKPSNEIVSTKVQERTADQARRTRNSLIDREPFQLFAHKPNYLMGVAYNDNQARNVSDVAIQDGDLQKIEAGFQISFKAPVARDWFGENFELYMSYTNRSFWQLYNSDASAPFRSSDHEPEVFLRYYGRAELGPFVLRNLDFGFSHQSNGRSRPESRSWNRLVGGAVIDAGRLSLRTQLWYRIPESSKDDDNPDIEDFLGYGELRAIYAVDDHTWSAMFRQGDRKGALELTWTYKLTDDVSLFTQYFEGYGETLLDYNRRVQRIGLGISLSDYSASTH